MVINVDNEMKDLLRSGKIGMAILQPTMTVATFKIPRVSNEKYNKLKYLLEAANGHWNERLKAFIFNSTTDFVRLHIRYLLENGSITLNREKVFKVRNQFYETPNCVANRMIEAAKICPGMAVLEPSAGRGALLRKLVNLTDGDNIKAVECNGTNVKHLRSLGFSVSDCKFEDFQPKCKMRFDRVLMNPPFGSECDIRHTMLAFDLLKPGGKLVGLMAENSLYYDRSITKKFTTWSKENNMKVTNLPYGSFVDSGTLVDVVMVEITRPM